MEGAQRAKSLGIPVYTVALGTPNGMVTFTRDGYSRTIPVPPDPGTLRRIAQLTGGRFYEARDAGTLTAVYKSLGSRLGRVHEWHEASAWFVGAGALIFLLAGLLGTRWLARLP
jgi:Ca-activated chloride channel family protein